jgi:hypothetical protein
VRFNQAKNRWRWNWRHAINLKVLIFKG